MPEDININSLNTGKDDQEGLDDLNVDESNKKSDKNKKQNPADQMQDMSQQAQGLSEAINLGVSTFGWSEIGRILLRILCNIIPSMEKIGKLNPKLKFYFSAIDMGKMIDLVQLLEFFLLVIIWGIIILACVILIAVMAYCLSGVTEALECALKTIGVI